MKYLGKTKLKEFSNNIFDDAGVYIENLFKSLLVKRWAFRHENEVCLLYMEMDDNQLEKDVYSYEIDTHSLISQIVIDPRLSKEKANEQKKNIIDNTGYDVEIKRSLLYTFPNDIIISAKKFDFTFSNI